MMLKGVTKASDKPLIKPKLLAKYPSKGGVLGLVHNVTLSLKESVSCVDAKRHLETVAAVHSRSKKNAWSCVVDDLMVGLISRSGLFRDLGFDPRYAWRV